MIKKKMRSLESLRKHLSHQMRKNRDKRVKELVELFYLAHKLQNVEEACARRGVSRDYYYRWWRRLVRSRYDIASLQAHSRRPKHSPKKLHWSVEMKIRQYRRRGCGAQMIHWLLEREHHLRLSVSTISYVLARRKRNLKRKKAQKLSHRRRYEMPIPGQRLQVDVKYGPRLRDGSRTFVYVAVDECTRWRFARAYKHLSDTWTLAFLNELYEKFPFAPQTIQTDNGPEFTYRFFGNHPHAMKFWCDQRGIRHRLIPPGEKELNGKVERSHRIDEQYFYWRQRWAKMEHFNKSLDGWIYFYNTRRPHGGLKGQTPWEKLQERALSLPFEPVDPKLLRTKKLFLKSFPERHSELTRLATQLQRELSAYNNSIRGA